jgi:hypothetical protein
MKYSDEDIKKWKVFYERGHSDIPKKLYDSIVKAAEVLLNGIDDGSLDIVDDTYQKSVFELLKQSKQIPLGIQAAKLEAYPEDTSEDNIPLADRKK